MLIPLLQAAGAGYAVCRAIDAAFERSWTRVAVYLMAGAFFAVTALAGSPQ